MGKQAKLRKHRSTTVVFHEGDWTSYDGVSFAELIQGCADRGASEVRLMLHDQTTIAHIREITRGYRYPIPVAVNITIDVSKKLVATKFLQCPN